MIGCHEVVIAFRDMELNSTRPFRERTHNDLDWMRPFAATATCVALGYNRAKVGGPPVRHKDDGPLLGIPDRNIGIHDAADISDTPIRKSTVAEMAWTYPLWERRCYPVEPVSVSRGIWAGAAAL